MEVADDRLYDLVEETLNASPSYDVKIITWDSSAKIRREEIYRITIGHHSLNEETNKNGQHFFNFTTSKEWLWLH